LSSIHQTHVHTTAVETPEAVNSRDEVTWERTAHTNFGMEGAAQFCEGGESLLGCCVRLSPRHFAALMYQLKGEDVRRMKPGVLKGTLPPKYLASVGTCQICGRVEICTVGSDFWDGGGGGGLDSLCSSTY
jgi:hypothetical protein